MASSARSARLTPQAANQRSVADQGVVLKIIPQAATGDGNFSTVKRVGIFWGRGLT